MYVRIARFEDADDNWDARIEEIRASASARAPMARRALTARRLDERADDARALVLPDARGRRSGCRRSCT